MDIMMRLKGAGFATIANEFRAREKQLGGGLPLQDFVEIVLQGLPRATTADEAHASVGALVDLFDEIDINGDGTMDFDEFTSFCIDAGMVATTRSGATTSTALKYRYVLHPKRVIKTVNGCLGIETVKWSSDFRLLVAIENTAKTAKLFDSTGAFVADVGGTSALQHELPLTPRANERMQHSRSSSSTTNHSADADRGTRASSFGARSDRPSSPHKRTMATERSASAAPKATTSSNTSGVFILDAAFIYKHKWLAVSTTDFVISFYDLDATHKPPIAAVLPDAAAAKRGPSFALVPALTITTTTAQLLLRFCEHADLLFSSGNDFVVNVWKLIDTETKVLWKRLVLHQNMVLDLIEVPPHDLLVSCDLEHTIHLWDMYDCRLRGSLSGHVHGVKQLVYSTQHDVLLSAGFEFDAYGWDLASRQAVMRLSGHRAPLVGVQIALFQTERAVTADCTGVFKVWDISRGAANGSSKAAGGASSAAGGTASQAVQLESIDPSQHFARFEPTAFVCLSPHSRDLWIATTGSSTLHCLYSRRVQQLEEIPLRAFYHYNANRFVVVTGPVCSIWDGKTGTCLEEFTHVGSSISHNTGDSSSDRKSRDRSRHNHKSNSSSAPARNTVVQTIRSSSTTSSSLSHNGSDSSTSAAEPRVEVLACVQDQLCKKLVVVTERGDLGVFNALNFVQMRKCAEVFYSPNNVAGITASTAPLQARAANRTPTCGIVGLHYCSINKLIVAADANESAILVIDDNTHYESARGMKETTVLRRLIHIPGGVTASAYGFHTCAIATLSELDSNNNCTLSLWDFETLSFVAHCAFTRDEDDDTGECSSHNSGYMPHALHLLEFWDEFPVLLSADTRGSVYFYAAMPLTHCHTGQLLHAFANNNSTNARSSSSDDVGGAASVGPNSDASMGEAALRLDRKRAPAGVLFTDVIAEAENEDDADVDADDDDAELGDNMTFITEATAAAAKKLLRWRNAKPPALPSANGNQPIATNNVDPHQQQQQQQQTPASAKSCAVTVMKVAFDDTKDRFVLITGDESGAVRLWDLSKMIARLGLAKIPEIKCKYLRRGYHPKAMFVRDCLKDTTASDDEPAMRAISKHRRHGRHKPLLPNDDSSDWRAALLASDEHDAHVQLSQVDLKRLSKQRLDMKKRATAVAVSMSTGGSKALQQQSNTAATASTRSAKQTKTANTAIAAAQAFAGKNSTSRFTSFAPSSAVAFSAAPASKLRRSLLPPTTASKRLASSRHEQQQQQPPPLNDVELICAWQAHSDALTSLEVNRHPDILITCALDMRVFVWNWHGMCLGKLFDAENIGRWKWQFTNDDSKRQHERDVVVTSLMRDLELTPLEKAHKRRQTLFHEHTARKSLKDLQRVNTILLDHIISKNPELELLQNMERDIERLSASDNGKSATGDVAGGLQIHHDGKQSRDTSAPETTCDNGGCTDTENSNGAVFCVVAPSLQQQQLVVPTHASLLRMHSLAQVGPLLGVNEGAQLHQTSLTFSTTAVTSTTNARLAERDDDLHTDTKYLEHGHAGDFRSNLNSRSSITVSGSNLHDVQRQIQSAHAAAKAAFESRVALERKTADMYANLERSKQRVGSALRSGGSATTTTTRAVTNATLDELLAPSEFLKQHIPASKLTVRPQTAPGNHKRLAQIKSASGLEVPHSHSADANHSGSLQRRALSTTTGAIKPAMTTTASENMHGSNSTPTLTSSSTRPSTAQDCRKSSLDTGFLEAVKRHATRKPTSASGGCGLPINSSMTRVVSSNDVSTGAMTIRKKINLDRGASSNGGGSASRSGSISINNDRADGSVDDDSNARSLHKLRGINEILSKAQAYSSSSPTRKTATGKSMNRPSTAPFARLKPCSSSSSNESTSSGPSRRNGGACADARVSSSKCELIDGTECVEGTIRANEDNDGDKEESDAFDTENADGVGATGTTTDDATTREHLEATKRKMAAAMRDGERSPRRSDVQRLRQNLQEQQKTRRMEDYLQQKRRELNTNIGNVFKRTSFAFQSKASDDPVAMALASGGGGSDPAATNDADAQPSKASSQQKPRHRAATAANTASSSLRAKVELEKSATVFGIYGVREVMAVIRLFWTMDVDGSGNISLDELLDYKHFFEKLGYADMATVFQAIDKDGSGHISLKELLETCFHYATKYQLDEMLQLAKVGNVRLYLQGGSSTSTSTSRSIGCGTGSSSSDVVASLSPETRRELLDIFHVFDKNGDGGVSMEEIMEALRVDDDDVIAKAMAEQASKRVASSSTSFESQHHRDRDATAPSGITKDDVERLYREFDSDGNASLDFNEFVALMHTLYGPKSNAYFR